MCCFLGRCLGACEPEGQEHNPGAKAVSEAFQQPRPGFQLRGRPLRLEEQQPRGSRDPRPPPPVRASPCGWGTPFSLPCALLSPLLKVTLAAGIGGQGVCLTASM